ncbi:MAG TPA: hypothetical protein VKD91_00140 [Pyrinomonadaceae bacterium]|nr:hypothetical protein [Pyrinomonadaceae bacterium]
MQENNPAIRIVEIILGLALLTGLVFGGWRVYRSLPAGAPAQVQVNDAAATSELTIVWRDGLTDGETKVELYPIDFAALKQDFSVNSRPGRNIDDYLAQRLRYLKPVRVPVSQNGRAVARLSEGNWWLRATSVSANGEALEWRVPILISQRKHTIELSKDNAYERTKKF